MIVYWTIPEGIAGVRATVGMMERLIRSPSPAVRERAERILWDAAVRSPEPNPRAHALYVWVQRHMRYTPDAEAHGAFPLEDVLYAPDDLLAQIDAQGYAEGDCDDYVILLGALCVALSIPCQIEVLSTRDDRMFDHVYLRLVDDTVMDAIPSGPAPIGAGEPFGWEVPPERVTNRGVFPLLH